MKKLNRKGFTLVELLAVIIILAIVVGITIPAITNIINDSKNNALGVAVDAASDFLTDQYAMMNVDYNTATTEFKNVFASSPTAAQAITGTLLTQTGLKSENVTSVKATLDTSTGKICVTVETIPTTSEYYSTEFWNTDGTHKTGAKYTNCTTTTPAPSSSESGE